ncbi:YbfB/YjiJ family MFS transporter [Rhodococcus sp. D2-41]|uniref:YbfB/YjiJ family MFS transporter n=1 Tax=Speluncibacter jeojiensis TaxID=2710754 RepID=UPI00240FDBEC|nr:YbfB/YjiJ family MFS transporter [Rhodococcus sp. D2-41]MDG3012532.1 YbfB/YjiJ family MFS transporter [Rhodococcus sp. D2-41]
MATRTAPPAHGTRLIALRAATALVVAMGVGRFAYTPILPLMESQAGLSRSAGAALATSNYLGYLVGAIVASVLAGPARSTAVLRGSLVAVVATLALMPVTTAQPVWLVLRFVAGVASALVFVFAARVAHDQLKGSPHGAGWVFGGVGAGIALSGAAVLALGDQGSWVAAWATVAALAAAGGAIAWNLPGGSVTGTSVADEAVNGRAGGAGGGNRSRFGWLVAAYFFEGLGYIVTATFLVAALAASGGPSWLGSSAWIVVGLAAFPSSVVWAWLGRRASRPLLLFVAMLVQAVAVALPAWSGSPAAALVSAVVFGGTFMGIVALALGEGNELIGPRAPAVLTAAYGVGQVIGPLVVAPLLAHGYSAALVVAAGIVAVGALCVLPLLARRRGPAGARGSHGFAAPAAGDGAEVSPPASASSGRSRLPDRR